MLIGKYLHALDEKGRLIIPAKIRDDLGEVFIISPGLDQCLFGYSLSQWEQVAKQIKELSTASVDRRAFERMFYADAVEAELDKQGRVVIPQHLRDYAQIERDVYVVGVSDKIELWSKENWEKYSGQARESYEAISKTDIRL